jgi:hypothetical protein
MNVCLDLLSDVFLSGFQYAFQVEMWSPVSELQHVDNHSECLT